MTNTTTAAALDARRCWIISDGLTFGCFETEQKAQDDTAILVAYSHSLEL